MTDSCPQSSNELRRRLIELTRDLIMIPSTADRPDDIRRCVEFAIHHTEACGDLRVLRFHEHGVLSAVLLPDGVERPEVMLFAHLDVVSLPDEAEYRSSIRDGRIYGPGAGDMKGEAAILLDLFRVLHEKHPGISMGLAVTSDEERGGTWGTRFLLEDFGLRCGTAIIPDSGSLNEIAVEEKGTLHLKIYARGTAGHACRPWLADNPLDRMVAAINRIQDHFNTLADGNGYWHPTCTFTAIYTSNRVPNRIPSNTETTCDIRFPPPYTTDQMIATIKGLLDKQMQLEILVSAEPTLLSPDPLYLKITEEITGQPVRLLREHGGSDARYVARYGIPVIMSRPYIGDLHTESEWIELESMETLYRIYERYLEAKLAV